MKQENFPSALQAFGLVLALFLCEYLVAAALYDARGLLNLTSQQMEAFTLLGANALVFTTVTRLKHMAYPDLFHPSKVSVRATAALLVPPVLLLIPLLLLLASGLTQLLVWMFPLSRWEEQMFQRMSSGNLASVIVICLLAPVLEEMLFRGVILRAFLNQYPRVKAIGLSALIFGLAHLNVYQFSVAFVLGVVAGWLYERSRSLIPCIALHATYNTCIVMVSAAQGSVDESADRLASSFPWLAAWIAALLSAGLGVFMLFRLLGTRPAPPSADAALP